MYINVFDGYSSILISKMKKKQWRVANVAGHKVNSPFQFIPTPQPSLKECQKSGSDLLPRTEILRGLNSSWTTMNLC